MCMSAKDVHPFGVCARAHMGVWIFRYFDRVKNTVLGDEGLEVQLKLGS